MMNIHIALLLGHRFIAPISSNEAGYETVECSRLMKTFPVSIGCLSTSNVLKIQPFPLNIEHHCALMKFPHISDETLRLWLKLINWTIGMSVWSCLRGYEFFFSSWYWLMTSIFSQWRENRRKCFGKQAFTTTKRTTH